MGDPDYRRYAGVVSRAGDGLGERGPQGFPSNEVPLGDPTRWGGRLDLPIVVPALQSLRLTTSQPIRVQCSDNYARLWQLFGVISADAITWQAAIGEGAIWQSALLVLTFGAGQNTVEVGYDVFTGVAQLCGAYPFQGPGKPFRGRRNGDLISCPFYYPPASPLIPANAISAHLETNWQAGEAEYTGSLAFELMAAPYAIATGA